MSQPLEDLVVLDFSNGWPGSIATMILSDFGAEVIKIEPPLGDPYRIFPESLLWNRGKKSVVLDLYSSSGISQAHSLISKADIIVESFSPEIASELGIMYDKLNGINPNYIHCSITGFGDKGPYSNYKAYEGIVAAKVGRYSVFTGQSNREGPHYGAVNISSHCTAMSAVRGILAALIVKHKTGLGQRVQTSLIQSITPYDISNWLIWQMMIKFPDKFQDDPASDPNRQPGVGYQPIRTKDGQWIQMANIISRLFRASLEAMELGYVLEDPKFQRAPLLMPAEREELRTLILEKGLEKTLDEWMDIFVNETSNVAAEPFFTSNQGMKHSQILHNPHIEQIHDPIVGEMHQLGLLVKMSRTPGSIKGPSPILGEHTLETLDRFISKGNNEVHNPSHPTTPPNPLTGITVLDLSTVIAGPLSTSLLYELGARVIRIETLEGDTMRRNFDGLGANRTQAGAENISINLQTPRGKEIFQELVKKSDVMIHNMRPGAPERLGADYTEVSKINPNIVYVYAGGYGDSGPHSHRPAMHPIGGAIAGGALRQLGRDVIPSPDTPMTTEEIKEIARRLGRSNETNPDPNSSMVISTGALLGLLARERFGTGQYILSTMLGANAYANADQFFNYNDKPDPLIPDSLGYGIHALYRLYKAKGGWIFLACLFQTEWESLCKILGDDILINTKFDNPTARTENDAELANILADIFSSKAPREWESLLTHANVACVEVEESGMFHFFSQDPHVEANEFIRPAENIRIGKYWRYGPVTNMSETPTRVGAGPLRGQHTIPILKELGYSEESIAELYASSTVDSEEPTVWGEAGH